MKWKVQVTDKDIDSRLTITVQALLRLVGRKCVQLCFKRQVQGQDLTTITINKHNVTWFAFFTLKSKAWSIVMAAESRHVGMPVYNTKSFKINTFAWIFKIFGNSFL